MASRHSLRHKIIAWSFVPTAIILGAVALLLLRSYQGVTEALVIERDRELTRLQAELLADDLSQYATLLTQIGQIPEILDGPPERRAATLRATRNRLAPFDAGVVLLDAQGRVLAALPDRPGLAGSNWLDRQHISQCQRQYQTTFSDIVVDGPDGSEVIAVTVPLLGYDGALRGMFCGLFHSSSQSATRLYSNLVRQIGNRTNPPEGAFRLEGDERPVAGTVESLYRLFQRPQTLSLSTSSHARAYLIDGQGRLIYHPEVAQIGYRLSTQEAVQRLAERQTGSVRTRDLEGRQVVASFAPVPGTPWGLVTEESWDALMAASQDYGRFLVLLLAAGLALPALVVTLAAYRITRPIQEVAAAAQQVAAGQFGQTIAATTHDEIEDLVEQFNTMSLRLGELYGHLEHRVSERTRTLSELNTIMTEVSRSLDAPTILSQALGRVVPFAQGTSGAAYRPNAAGALCLEATYGPPPPWPAKLPTALGASCLRVDQPLVCLPSDGGAAWLALPNSAAIDALIVLPLIAQDRALGLLLLACHPAPELDGETLHCLAAVGHQIGLAIENASLFEQARQVATLSERQRLARDLHDSVTQSLYGASLYASAARRLLAKGDTAQAQNILGDLEKTTLSLLQEMRLLIFELRPSVLEEQGLESALRTRLAAVEGRSGVQTSIEVGGPLELAAPVSEALYGIAQEALNNVLRHAQATAIAVSLSQEDGHARLQIRDNGLGFDPATASAGPGLGLRGMQERANEVGAALQVISAPGAGTRVLVEVPL